ncbi:restriction endonuclease [Candidatus Oscillochloris fontis]|uniref:restriction endonuclease n=1 Tax=Candidatus Oscillochloris fontis TaxID=2496868 RepID=UPI00101C2DD3|nr:restriction endonuclease [Candidatus Oscillochloris fontis]
MARRRSGRTRSDASIAGLGVVICVALFSTYRWIEGLSNEWRVAVVILALSTFCLVAWAIVNLIRHAQRRRLNRIALSQLTPTEFELRVQQLLADLGWTKLQHHGGSGDRGTDLTGSYQGKRYVIQCKRYRKKIPPSHIRDLIGTLYIQKADRALLVTTSGFTAQGYAEARNQPIDLWDGETLAMQIEQATARQADPSHVQATRRRIAVVVIGAVLINIVAIAYAFLATGSLPYLGDSSQYASSWSGILPFSPLHIQRQ